MSDFASRLRTIESKILYFNSLYKLPIAAAPSLEALSEPVAERLAKFKKTLMDEIHEIDAIIGLHEITGSPALDTLTEVADLLGDIMIYCLSEAAKYGLPMDEVLHIIMNSNFSKLGADGNPIYNEDGKVMKGPGYWKPEPQIKELLQKHISGEV